MAETRTAIVRANLQNPDKNREQIQIYVEENNIKGRVGYVSELELTAQQTLELEDKPYVDGISFQNTKAKIFRA